MTVLIETGITAGLITVTIDGCAHDVGVGDAFTDTELLEPALRLALAAHQRH